MQALIPHDIYCPYCGEVIEILIDNSVPAQQYIEDCQVCCRPITIKTKLTRRGELEVAVSHENEV
ncbi:MAG: CPXCG motif-containing cysteine-rich protein [Gammaproteobacteria bacterium]|nr:CPXCG motif-containing cysteine-rich protein [Gammaproteobacteria bacterium]